VRVLSHLLGLSACERFYAIARADRSAAPFENRALNALHISLDATGVESLPRNGPLLIVANHPHGAVDGLALLSLVKWVRPDVRALANSVLARIPEMHDACFFVDPFGGPGAAERSRAGLRAAHLWLRRGGALVMFPSGEVAHGRANGENATRDESPWHSTAGRLAEQTRAAIVPVSIEGCNSRLFYAAGGIHPALRTALLAHELLRLQRSTIRITIHRPLTRARRLAPIATEQPAERIEREIAALPPSTRLVDSAPFEVYCAEARQIPLVLSEIGRLREITFRAAGEGTGRARDVDAFDDRYLHLFAWDTRTRRLAGAYRLGRADQIVARHGVEGLYTRTLFRFDARLFDRQPAALELGRSFVRQEYQRHSTALFALWKGIGRFVWLHREYRRLFGCVSISSRYSDTSQMLLRAFLEQHHRHDALADLVDATRPPQAGSLPARHTAVPASMAEIEELVREAEHHARGVPVLLRHYVKLNARLLGFNVDPAFGDALDALMMVDLADVDARILRPYFGRDAAALFNGRRLERVA
jgi:putative hemolysin